MPEEDTAEEGDDPQRLVCVTPLTPGLGIDTLVSAFGMLAGDLPGLLLHVIGEGPLEGALREHVRGLALEDRVHLHGGPSLPPGDGWRAVVLPRRVEDPDLAPAVLLDVYPDPGPGRRCRVVAAPDDPAGLATALLVALPAAPAASAPAPSATRRPWRRRPASASPTRCPVCRGPAPRSTPWLWGT
ncbi:hypothetical protein [Geodermatophilus sp. SYSU D00815]